MGAIIINVIKKFYEQFLAALIFAVMFIICYQRMKEEGWKQVLKKIVGDLKHNAQIRKIFLFAFVLSMVLFNTVFCRVYQSNPLKVVFEHWIVFQEYHILHTEPIENILLFIPYTFCVLWAFPKLCFKGKKEHFFRCVWKSFLVGGISSLGIEVIQLLFHVGTFQFSDLTYNTIGGIMGGIAYYVLCLIRRRRS